LLHEYHNFTGRHSQRALKLTLPAPTSQMFLLVLVRAKGLANLTEAAGLCLDEAAKAENFETLFDEQRSYNISLARGCAVASSSRPAVSNAPTLCLRGPSTPEDL